MSSTDAHKRLEKLIETKSKQDCLDFFKGMPAEERRTFAKLAKRKYKEADRAWKQDGVDRLEKRFRRNSPWDEQDNAMVCILATATLGEIRKHRWLALPRDGFIVNVVRAIKPDWTNDWVQLLLDDEPRCFSDIRLLFDAGLCDKPTSDGYILGMIEGLSEWYRRSDAIWPRDMSLADRIRNTPDIRDEDVWRLFAVEGGGEFSLATFDKYCGGSRGGWAGTLTELAADGTLSRDRLLDESLHALERDFAQFRAGWFSRFHEQLKPTIDERTARLERYLRLLGSSIPPTVSFALKAIGVIDKSGKLPPEELLAHARPVLQARAKGTVSTALRLLARAAKREPGMSTQIARLAADALLHEAADVQGKVLDLIESLDGQEDPGVVAAMLDYADGIAPSVRGRFVDLVGSSATSPNQEVQPSHPGESSTSDVEPIGSFDELNADWLRVIEDPSNPLDVERVLDGLARWGAAKPGDFQKAIGPLAKRAAVIVDRQPEDRLQFLLAWLATIYAADTDVRQWVTDSQAEDASPQAGSGRGTGAFAEVFAIRGVDLLLQIQDGHQLPMISAPTDSRGFVAAESLLSRYAAYREKDTRPGVSDMALALMRLAPEGRLEALESLEPKDESEAAIAFALGGESPVGNTDWLWVAAAAARLPYADQPEIAKKHGHGLPDAGTRASYEVNFNDGYFANVVVQPPGSADLRNGYVLSRFHIHATGLWNLWSTCGDHVNMIRWSAGVWPLNLEPFFSQGIQVYNHDQPLANSPYAGFLEPMLENHVTIGEMGSVMLMFGLASTDPAVRSVALDSLIAAIAEERISVEFMQDAMILLMASGHIPVGRWTKTLGEVSTYSGKHADFVRELISGSLRHDPESPPRDLGGLVELLYELSVLTKTPVSDEKTIRYLGGIKGGGKLKRFAAKLLAGQ